MNEALERPHRVIKPEKLKTSSLLFVQHSRATHAIQGSMTIVSLDSRTAISVNQLVIRIHNPLIMKVFYDQPKEPMIP